MVMDKCVIKQVGKVRVELIEDKYSVFVNVYVKQDDGKWKQRVSTAIEKQLNNKEPLLWED